ncbi:MAG: ABC transporter ATP-binding protein, partial [Planctomycetota bacterium]|nr:ABC transporter ATP-binding protein [Planctomycetota bacterium]
MTAVLTAVGVHKTYRLGRREIPVLQGIDMSLMEGEIAALVGASGAGKSTLVHVLGLLDPPTQGTVHYGETDVTTLPTPQQARLRHEHVGFVFQFYHLIPELNALENVCLGSMMTMSLPGWLSGGRRVKQRARELLSKVGLEERLRHRPSQLSGGERQRVAIARALIAEPKVILADEPTGNLDSNTAAGILDLIWEINEERRISFLLVTHNEAVARRCDRRIRL